MKKWLSEHEKTVGSTIILVGVVVVIAILLL